MSRSSRCLAALLTAAVVSAGPLAAPRACAQIWDNGGDGNNWANSTNWNTDTEPTSASTVGIGRPGYDADAYAVVTEPGEAAGKIFMGWSGSTGTLVIVSGDLTDEGELYLGYQGGGAGHIIQSNGTVTCKKSGHFRLGAAANSVGTYVLEDGVLEVTGDLAVGALGHGVLECRGGLLKAGSGIINVGSAAGATGFMTLEADGDIAARVLYVGNAGTGTFTQNGGTNILSAVFVTDDANTSTGTYVLAGGSLVATNFFIRHGVGRFEQADGTTVTAIDSFRLGYNDAAARAAYTMRGGTLIVQNDFEAPYIFAAHSELRGWGSVAVTNTSRHFELKGANAFVCADGFGEDRELALDFTSLPNNDPNDPNTSNGWYATNHGKLTLRDVSVTADTAYWGEDSGGGPNRANSVQLTFTGRSGSGSLTGALLAPDHGDVPAFEGDAKIAGVWKLEHSGFSFTSVDLTFRYAPAALTELGLAESEAMVFRHGGGPGDAWTELAGVTRDEANNRITAPAVGGLGFLAVGTSGRPTGTLVLIR